MAENHALILNVFARLRLIHIKTPDNDKYIELIKKVAGVEDAHIIASGTAIAASVRTPYDPYRVALEIRNNLLKDNHAAL